MSEPTFETYEEEVAYKRGFVDGDVFAEQRISKLLEDDCECIFEINKYYSGCHNHQLIALINGENK